MTTESHQTTVTGTDASCSCGWSMPGWSNEQQAKEAAEGHRLYHAEYQARDLTQKEETE